MIDVLKHDHREVEHMFTEIEGLPTTEHDRARDAVRTSPSPTCPNGRTRMPGTPPRWWRRPAGAACRSAPTCPQRSMLVNNVAYQETADDLAAISTEQWRRTFAVNVDGFYFVTKAALPHLQSGASVINTSSINGLRGNKTLIDYSATKGAILALTYSLAQSLVEKGIRVNCVAPGPVWTPLIPATMPEQKAESFGKHVPMRRPAHPDEIAPSYVFLAADRLSLPRSGGDDARLTAPGAAPARRPGGAVPPPHRRHGTLPEPALRRGRAARLPVRRRPTSRRRRRATPSPRHGTPVCRTCLVVH
jgi:NAD(P)-dependent dehydrogenase (short-subunit alcohol dehydrogenase family)